MFTAIITEKHEPYRELDVHRYFDYTRSEVLYMARMRFKDIADKNYVLTIWRDGGGYAFPFGRVGRKIYEKTP